MKQTTPAAMPRCFDRWCKRFDDVFSHQAQKREFRNISRGIIGGKRAKKPVSNGIKCGGSDLPQIASLVRLNSEETSEAAHPLFDRSTQGMLNRLISAA